MANKIYSLVFTSGDPRTTTVLTPTLVVFSRQDTGGALTAPGITQAIVSSGIFQFEYQPTLPIAFIADGGASAPSSTRYLAGNLDPIQWVDQQAVTLTAIGTTNIALGTTSVALGITAVSLGTTMVAIGTTNFALGTTAVALGNSNIALSVSAIINTIAFGNTGNALGTTNVAIGTTLIGYGTSIYAGTQTLLSYGSTSNAIGLSILAALGTTASSVGGVSADPVDVMGYLKRNREWTEGTSNFNKTSGLWQVKTRDGLTLLVERTLSNAVTTVTKT